jgi:hypothetical protein
MIIVNSDHVPTSHVGHVAWLVLAALLGSLVGYAIGVDLQNSQNIENVASIKSVSSTKTASSSASASATSTPSATSTSATSVASPTTAATNSATSNWQAYANLANNYGFSYPKTSTETKSSTPPSGYDSYFFDKIYDLNTMTDEPMGYSKDTLLSLQKDLQSGKVKTAIAGKDAYTYLTLQQIDMCDVRFVWTLNYFKGDKMVRVDYALTPTGITKAIADNSTYFTIDEASCGTAKVWEDPRTESFRNDLLAGKTADITKTWNTNFTNFLTTFYYQ